MLDTKPATLIFAMLSFMLLLLAANLPSRAESDAYYRAHLLCRIEQTPGCNVHIGP